MADERSSPDNEVSDVEILKKIEGMLALAANAERVTVRRLAAEVVRERVEQVVIKLSKYKDNHADPEVRGLACETLALLKVRDTH